MSGKGQTYSLVVCFLHCMLCIKRYRISFKIVLQKFVQKFDSITGATVQHAGSILVANLPSHIYGPYSVLIPLYFVLGFIIVWLIVVQLYY